MAFLCAQCDQPESKCQCERFCCLCQSQRNVRLVGDGLYYCVDCREVCDYHTEEGTIG